MENSGAAPVGRPQSPPDAHSPVGQRRWKEGQAERLRNELAGAHCRWELKPASPSGRAGPSRPSGMLVSHVVPRLYRVLRTGFERLAHANRIVNPGEKPYPRRCHRVRVTPLGGQKAGRERLERPAPTDRLALRLTPCREGESDCCRCLDSGEEDRNLHCWGSSSDGLGACRELRSRQAPHFQGLPSVPPDR